jgi:LacI family transcriptional regulator
MSERCICINNIVFSATTALLINKSSWVKHVPTHSMTESYTTLRQIAETLGVHPSTVSMALREHPRIPAHTRLRVQEKAKEMGYRPDPILRALQAHSSRNRTRRSVATMALVILHERMELWSQHHSGLSYLQGIQRRIDALGFQLETFCLPELKRQGKSLDRILRARGIRALLLASPPALLTCNDLPWEHYSTTTLGYSVTRPLLHRAVHHYRFAIKTTLEQLRLRGYKRFGLVYSPSDELRLQDGWTGGFRVEQGRNLLGEHFLFYRQQFTPSIENFPRELHLFQRWVVRHRPEVILASSDWVPKMLRREMGLNLPKDMGFVHLARDPQDPADSGIDQQLDEVGVSAIDLLAGMVHQHEFGLPRVPKIVVQEGKWVEGHSLHPI